MSGGLPRAPLRWRQPDVTRGVTAPLVPVIPTYLRLQGIALDYKARERIRKKVRTRFAKFSAAIERISVRVEDLNGPRGGVDQLCRIKVVLSRFPSVVLERRGTTLEEAVDGAIDGAVRTVRRQLQRRRMRPLKGRKVP